MKVTSLDVARIAALAADAKKAEDLLVLDLSKLSDMCDYFVICTAQNRRMVDAIADEIEERVAANADEHPASIEGREEGSWVLMDYGSVVVHIFTPEMREFFRLEHLWGDAAHVSWEQDD